MPTDGRAAVPDIRRLRVCTRVAAHVVQAGVGVAVGVELAAFPDVPTLVGSPIGGGDPSATSGVPAADSSPTHVRKATVEPSPATLQTDFDGIVAQESPLVAAAPNELQPDCRVILQVLQWNRATLAQANWTAAAFVRTLSTNLTDNDDATASANIATYPLDRCGIDVTNRAGA
jgi:hypothetical protein